MLLRDKVNLSDKKRLLSNFLSLSVLQAVSYILPLITLPYLVRVLGVEHFGLLSFATAMMTYFSIIIDYGFNLTATREISIYRDEKEKVIEIFSSVMIIKAVLLALSLLTVTIIIFSFEMFSKDWLIYLLTFSTIIGQTFFPIWFFQGMQEMRYITYLNILSKSVFTVAIFVFVQDKNDFYLVPILTLLGSMTAAIWSLVIIKKFYRVNWQPQKFNTVIFYLKGGWHVFLSNFSNGLYTNSTIFILGIFTNNTLVGYYSAGERIIKVMQNLFTPLFQVFYPYISQQKKDFSLDITRKLTVVVGLIALIMSLLIFYNSENLVSLVLGKEFESSIIVIKILSFLPLTYVLSNIFGVQTMLTHGREKAYSKIFIYATILNLILSFILIPVYEEVGTAIVALTTELFFVLVMFFYLQSTGLKIVK
jgi:polysaccharide transporter, PST family